MLGIGHIIIIGKTANFTHVQKTVIDTLHNEGKLQKVFAKEVFFFFKKCCTQAYWHKIEQKEKCDRRRCTSNGDSWEDYQTKSI